MFFLFKIVQSYIYNNCECFVPIHATSQILQRNIWLFIFLFIYLSSRTQICAMHNNNEKWDLEDKWKIMMTSILSLLYFFYFNRIPSSITKNRFESFCPIIVSIVDDILMFVSKHHLCFHKSESLLKLIYYCKKNSRITHRQWIEKLKLFQSTVCWQQLVLFFVKRKKVQVRSNVCNTNVSELCVCFLINQWQFTKKNSF